MASKIVAEYREYLPGLVIDAILRIAQKTRSGYKVDIDDIKVEKKVGESIVETKLIKGMVIDKEVIHPSMPKRIKGVNIMLLNSPMEVEKPEFTTKIHIERPEEMKAFLDEEEQMLKTMVDKVIAVGANVLACQKGIDEIAQHFLAKGGIMAFRRLSTSNMEKLAKATGGKIITNIEDLTSKDLGHAKLAEERKLGDDKRIFIEGCKSPKAVTILIRGGTEKIINEVERSIHDALCVVRDIFLRPMVVAGGGAPEIEVASRLRKWAEQLSGKEQLAATGFAESLEVISVTLAENAGLDPIDILVELRSSHEKGNLWAGVEVFEGKVGDMAKLNVYEPLIVKEQIIKSASEAASMIIRIDDVIASGKTKGPSMPSSPPGGLGEMED